MKAVDIPHAEYVSQLSRHLASIPASHIDLKRRSAVAIIIRLVLLDDTPYPTYTPPAAETPESIVQACEGFLNEFHNARAQLLFIQRAHHDKDPWSGHIGFPGGKREAQDQSDQQTAERETREELGLDLQKFVHLGQLDDAPAYMFCRGTKLVVSPHVYLQTTENTPPLLLSDEVASAHWIGFDHLLSKVDNRVDLANYHTVKSMIVARMVGQEPLGWWQQLLSAFVGSLHYTVLELPFVARDSLVNPKIAQKISPFATDTELHLWGLSLIMAATLVDMSLPVAPVQLPQFISIAGPWPQLGNWLWTDVNAITNFIHNRFWSPYCRKPWQVQRSSGNQLLAYFRILPIAFSLSCAAKATAVWYLGRQLWKYIN
ncbi:hypothetical protein LPJ78_002310 [Coemansia sp. RSA 989]|nr:hypothetical protein BX667DRAFT_509180 [Coemansia mojavensis]KAJ1740869.1 hypothetical protein LPJ68_003367 [Coemansia sp. RSA 1086]KAJ1749199.1 hypothetical protein LPJ79_003910 [Coemansia sp. RSA 1821]KAJ1865910.1 hypothetical protein LPJ78_002310 [Coemansia sp. RSA 989]KAJ1873055.1 hypothetical protein LPJ55_002617 [Coemansia sp. RSA 990]KAJ2647855.1 hypothetical protein IWW40_004380 [Coemansia sp. RSA 1250]KAJ2673348.1 hypothetical protein IWW42_002358 [Coemansia sp. RSA 1085]